MSVRAALAAAGLLLACTGCALRAPVERPGAVPPAAIAPGTTVLATTPSVAPPAAAAPVTTEEAPAMVREPRVPDDAERLLNYFERLRRLQGAELAKEHEASRAAYGRAASEYNRVGYAMTLALPGTAFNDDARALELLNPLVKKSEQGLRPLALLLATFIQERRRLGGDLAAVQQKLAALKSLERALIERDQNNLGRKP